MKLEQLLKWLKQAPTQPAQSDWAPIVRGHDNIPEVTAQWVCNNGANLRLVDVREPDELRGPLSAIPDVENVPLRSLPDVAGDWDRQQALVVLCRSGGRSGRAAVALERMGFRKVASLQGGMITWNQLGLPTESRGTKETRA